jgi:hypothetical protein
MTDEIEIFNSKFGDEVKEITIITGTRPIVYAKVNNGNFYELSIPITAWKHLESKEIFSGGNCFLTIKTDNSKMEELSEILLPDTILSLKVKQNENLFLLLEIIANKNVSNKFNKILQKQLQPVTCVEKILGKFTLDKKRSVYTNIILWNDHSITLEIEESAGQRLANAFIIARKLVQDQAEWHKKVVEFAARKLVKVKNKQWLDTDEAAIKGDVFMHKIKLKSIYVSLIDQFKFNFDDGDIFWGHPIIVIGNLEKGPMRAEIIE